MRSRTIPRFMIVNRWSAGSWDATRTAESQSAFGQIDRVLRYRRERRSNISHWRQTRRPLGLLLPPDCFHQCARSYVHCQRGIIWTCYDHLSIWERVLISFIYLQASTWFCLSFIRSDVDGVLRRANASEYGLASGVITRDLSKALYVTDKLQAGTVFVNTYNKTDVAAPFGGFKQSGFGKDLGIFN